MFSVPNQRNWASLARTRVLHEERGYTYANETALVEEAGLRALVYEPACGSAKLDLTGATQRERNKQINTT